MRKHAASSHNAQESKRRLTAFLLSAVFLYSNVIASHAAEAHFWAERRNAARRMKGDDSSTASPSSGLSTEQYQMLAQLPRAGQVAFGVPQGVSVGSGLMISQPSLTGAATLDLPAPSADSPTWISTLILPYGSVREVHLAKKPGAPIVVHIQDAHGIEEAQKNMAAMIQGLRESRGVSLVGVEGAEGAFNLEPYRDWPDAAVTRDIAEYFLKEGKIGGPELVGITAPQPPVLWGVEDTGLYLANVTTLREAIKEKPAMDKALADLKAAVVPLKDTFYSPDLKGFDKHFRAYQDQKEGLGAYVRYLMVADAGRGERFPNLRLLIKALVAEDALDFKRVEKERLELVEMLARRLPRKTLDLLVQRSFQYRAGQMGYGDYHRFLQALCRDNNIPLNDFKQLKEYIAYILLAEDIDRNELLNELTRAEKETQDHLTVTSEQKRLVAVGRRLALLEKLAAQAMTPDDWAAYQDQRAGLLGIVGDITALGGKSSATISSGFLKPFEDFCGNAVGRNAAFIGRLTEQMKEQNASAAVLVAGGFHSDGLTRLMREKDLSYVVVTPKITEVPKDNNYLDVFARDPLPLEKLFSGDEVFLNFARLTAGKLRGQMGKEFGPQQDAFGNESLTERAAVQARKDGEENFAEIEERTEAGARQLHLPLDVDIVQTDPKTVEVSADVNGDGIPDVTSAATDPDDEVRVAAQASGAVETRRIGDTSVVTGRARRTVPQRVRLAMTRTLSGRGGRARSRPSRSDKAETDGDSGTSVPPSVTAHVVSAAPASSGGLIGKYRLLSDPRWDPDAKKLTFLGQDIENPGKPPEMISIGAEVVGREFVEGMLLRAMGSNNEMVREILDWFDEVFKGRLLILEDNALTQGIGAMSGDSGIIAVSKQHQRDFIAWFHEVAEAMSPNPEAILQGLDQDSRSWYDRHMAKGGRQGMERHYAIRALQREAFGQEDIHLTYKIKGRLSADTVVHLLARSRLKTSRPVRLEFYRRRGTVENKKQELALLQELVDAQRQIEQEEEGRQQLERAASDRRQAEEMTAKERINLLLKEAKAIIESPHKARRFDYKAEAQEDAQKESEALEKLRPLLGMNSEWVGQTVSAHMVKDSGSASKINFLLLRGGPSFSHFLVEKLLPHLGEQTAVQIFLRLLDQRSALPTGKSGRKKGIHGTLIHFVARMVRFGLESSEEITPPLLSAIKEENTGPPSVSRYLVQDIREFKKFFTVQGNDLFLPDDFMRRIRSARNMTHRKRLHALYTEAVHDREFLDFLARRLLGKDSEGHLFDVLSQALVEEKNPFVRAALENLLMAAWNEKLPASREKLARLVQAMESTLDQSPDDDFSFKTMGRFIYIANKEPFPFPEIYQAISRVAQQGSDALFETATTQSAAYRGMDPGKERDAAYKRFSTMMKEVESRLGLLSLIALKTASNSSSPVSVAIAERTLAYLAEVARSDKWDFNVRSEAISLLGQSVEKGQTTAAASLVDLMEPNLPGSEKTALKDLFSKNPSDRQIIDALRTGKVSVGTGYLLLRRYMDDEGRKNLLQAVAMDRLDEGGEPLGIDIRFRLYAFSAFGAKHLSYNEKDSEEKEILRFRDELFQEMAKSLAKAARSFLDGVVNDDAAIEKLFKDVPGQDDELGVYATATTLVLHDHLNHLTAKGFSAIAKKAVSARSRDYFDNATHSLVFGGEYIRQVGKPANYFFQVMAHELMHLTLEHQYDYSTGGLIHGTAHELLADMLALTFSEIMDLSEDTMAKALRFEDWFANVENDDYHTIDIHEGARAQLVALKKALSGTGQRLDTSKWIHTALEVLPGTSGDALETVIGKILRRYAGLSPEAEAEPEIGMGSPMDYHNRDFDEFDEGGARQRILDPNGLRRLLETVSDTVSSVVSGVMAKGPPAGREDVPATPLSLAEHKWMSLGTAVGGIAFVVLSVFGADLGMAREWIPFFASGTVFSFLLAVTTGLAGGLIGLVLRQPGEAVKDLPRDDWAVAYVSTWASRPGNPKVRILPTSDPADRPAEYLADAKVVVLSPLFMAKWRSIRLNFLKRLLLAHALAWEGWRHTLSGNRFTRPRLVQDPILFLLKPVFFLHFLIQGRAT